MSQQIATPINSEEIYEILNDLYEDKELRRRKVPLFLGNPGLGKSYMVNKFAKDKGIRLESFIASARSPFEVSGMAIPDREKNLMAFWDFDTLLSMEDGDILFVDEVLNGNKAVLDSLLTLLEDRVMISGKRLADIIIVAAANPQGMCPLTPQIKERFEWYEVQFNSTEWTEYMKAKYDISNTIAGHLCRLIKDEDFRGYNFNTPRSLDKAILSMVKNRRTPYKDRLLNILSEPVYNETDQDLQLPGMVLKPGDSISWLKLKQMENEIIEK